MKKLIRQNHPKRNIKTSTKVIRIIFTITSVLFLIFFSFSVYLRVGSKEYIIPIKGGKICYLNDTETESQMHSGERIVYKEKERRFKIFLTTSNTFLRHYHHDVSPSIIPYFFIKIAKIDRAVIYANNIGLPSITFQKDVIHEYMQHYDGSFRFKNKNLVWHREGKDIVIGYLANAHTILLKGLEE